MNSLDQRSEIEIRAPERRQAGTVGCVTGPDPAHRSCSSLASFVDANGNGWVFQDTVREQAGEELSS
jgi:hypothetical protein